MAWVVAAASLSRWSIWCSRRMLWRSFWSIPSSADSDLINQQHLKYLMEPINAHPEECIVDTSLEECKKRDAVIRPFFTNCFWDCLYSFELHPRLFVEPFIDGWRPYHLAYPYVFEFKWELFPNSGHFMGDFLFSDGMNRFLVVELSQLVTQNPTKRRDRKRDRKRKLVHGMHMWLSSQPQVVMMEGVLVTENGFLVAEPLVRRHVNESLIDDNLS